MQTVTSMTRQCDACGKTVFAGRFVDYEYPPGNWKQDIVGDFEDGIAQCDICGKLFCGDCNNELDGGLCLECFCEDEGGYIPF